MNFLELAKMAARESGTVSGDLPVSVSGQTGRLDKIVRWTAEAWNRIQVHRTDWLWMRDDFEGVTANGIVAYTGASWNAPRLVKWHTGYDAISAYPAGHPNEEGFLIPVPWEYFRRQWGRAEPQFGRPREYSISPRNELCLGPVPDGEYVIRGEYQKGPQILAANTDVPELPLRFHSVIGWYALILLAEHDEAGLHIATAQRNFRELMGDLQRDQLPQLFIGARALA